MDHKQYTHVFTASDYAPDSHWIPLIDVYYVSIIYTHMFQVKSYVLSNKLESIELDKLGVVYIF